MNKTVAGRRERFVRLGIFALAVTAFFGLVALVALYLSFSPRDNPQLVETSIFHPTKGLPDPNPLLNVKGIEGREVTFQSDGNKLDAWYFKCPNAHNVVLLSHAAGVNSSFWTNKVAAFLECQCSVLIYDYQGYGLSEGRPTPSGIIDDGLAAYDYLTTKLGYAPDQIIGYGHSLGTGVTAELMKRRRFSKVILESGFTSMRNVIEDKMPIMVKIYPKSMWFTPGFETVDTLKQPHVPLLLVHGMKDTEIKVHHSTDLYQAASEPKTLVLLPNSEHNRVDPADEHKYIASLGKFLGH